MPPVRILACDLDFTLLDDDRNIVPANVKALRKAHEAGIRLVFASGRFPPTMRPYAELLGLPCAYVGANGCFVEDWDGNVLGVTLTTDKGKRIVLDYAVSRGVHLTAYTTDSVLFLNDTEWGRIYASRIKYVTPKVVGKEGVLAAQVMKMMALMHPDEKPRFLRDLPSVLDEAGVAITETEPEYVEFLPREADKALGLALLAASIGVGPDEVAAIGDYDNDAAMLAWAGQSAAVANASLAAKNAAKLVVASSNDAGVAEFIDLLVRDTGE